MLAKIVKLSCALLTPCYFLFAIFMAVDSFFPIAPSDQLGMISFYVIIIAFLMFLGIFILQSLEILPSIYEKKSQEVKENVDIKKWEVIILIGILITAVLTWVGDKYIESLKIGLDMSNGVRVLFVISAMFWVLYLQIPRQKK